MQTDLLRTKLFIPPARAGLVSRRHLLEHLDAALQRGQPLTLISAPPGFGKTTLVTEWISRHPEARFCWLSIDEADNDPVRFWRYMIAALQTAVPECGLSALAALSSPQEVLLTAVASGLINDLVAQDAPLVLVLDDYHLIETGPIHESLGFFLDYLPPQVHLTLATRSDPPLQLARRRGRGLLNEIRAADLRFSTREIAEFFNESMRLGLAQQDIAALEARTEGWIAGMQMAAVTLQGVEDKHAAVMAFSGDDRYIADYLVEEVLSRQSPAVQEFLLRTSVLERLNASLCDAIIQEGDQGRHPAGQPKELILPAHRQPAQEILEYLERGNLFLVPLDSRRQWFRFHHLFAQLLRQRLEKLEGSGLVLDLQRRATLWYDINGLAADAIHLALTCQDFDYAAQMIRRIAGQMFVNNDMTTLVNWVEALPSPVLVQFPSLIIAAAWATHATGRSHLTLRYLDLVEKVTGIAVESHILDQDRLPELSPERRGLMIEAGVITLRLMLDKHEVDRASVLADRLLPYLTGERDKEPYTFNPPTTLRPPLVFQIGLISMMKGDLDAAARYFEDAGLNHLGNFHIQSIALGFLAQLEYQRRNYSAARKVCQKAFDAIQALTTLPSAFFSLAYVIYGLLDLEEGKLESAEKQLRTGIDLALLWNFWPALIRGFEGLARLAVLRGNRAEAKKQLEQLAEIGKGVPEVEQALPGLNALLWQEPVLQKARKIPVDLLPEPLSDREVEVLGLLAGGASNAQVAAKLFVTINTVKKHITNIYGKLGVENRVQAIEKGRRLGLIEN